jgi:hypothetical protein
MDYIPTILYKKWIILCFYILVCAIPHKEKRHQSVNTDAFLMIYNKKYTARYYFTSPSTTILSGRLASSQIKWKI